MATDDWQDMYEGDHSQLGGNPYAFSGKLPQMQPQQTQQMGGGGTLAGLAQALMKYGNNSGGQVYNSPQYGQDDASWANGYHTNGGQMPDYLS